MLYAKTISFYSGPHFATNTFVNEAQRKAKQTQEISNQECPIAQDNSQNNDSLNQGQQIPIRGDSRKNESA